MLEGARQRFAYSSYGVSDYILRTGFSNPTFIAYNNWPSFQIFTAIFVLITGIDANFLIPLSSSFLMEILMLLPLYFIFKAVSNNDSKIWLSLWTFYLANCISRDYLSSQTFGFILFILIFTLLFFLINKNPNNDYSKDFSRLIVVTIISLFIAVVAGHELSAIIILSILFALYITKYFKRKILFFSLIAITISWTVYAANAFVKSNFQRLLSELLNFLPNIMSNVNRTGTVNQIWERVLTNEVKMVYAAIFIMFAFIGLFISYKRKTLNRTDKTIVFTISGIWLISAVPYGGELFTRLWLFSLPFIVFFAVKNIDHRKIFAIFAIFLILFAPIMFVWARYGEETFDYIPPSELCGSKFLLSSVPNGFFIGGDPWTSAQGSYGRYHIQFFNFIENKNNVSSALKVIRSDLLIKGDTDPLYLIINRGNSEYYRRLYNDPTFFDDVTIQLSNSTLFNKIYSNPDFVMYGSSS
jgi:hypothetical protein